jgi:hypothetical protein
MTTATQPEPAFARESVDTDADAPRTDAEWLYGDSPAGLRQRAAEELADEFGTDVSEWLI